MKVKLSLLSLLTVALLAVCSFGQNGPASVTLKEAYIPLPGGATAIYGSAGTLQYYRHTDGIGDTTLVSPSTAPYSATTSVNTAPFGEEFDDSCGTCSNSMYDFNFSGMGQDDATQGGVGAGYGGLYGTPSRIYSAVQGRWLSPDPVVGGNAYVYANNAPVVNSDPTGLQDGWDCDDDSCDVWISWDWGDNGGWYGWDGWDWGWGNPSLLTSDLTGSGGGWWSTTSGSASYFISYLAAHPYSTYTTPTGAIQATVYAGWQADRAGVGQCLSGCSSPTNAGETAEMRSQRYLTYTINAISTIVTLFNPEVAATAEARVTSPFNFDNMQGAYVEWQEVESLPVAWGRVYGGDAPLGKGTFIMENGQKSFSLYLEDLDGLGTTKMSNHYGYLGLDHTFENSTSAFVLKGIDGKLVVAPNEFITFPNNQLRISHAYFKDMQQWKYIKPMIPPPQ